MSYVNLPPGRSRMLSYSNYLENRNRSLHRLQLSPIRIRNSSYVSNQFYTRSIYTNIFTLPIMSTIHENNIPLNYNTLTNLEDVKVGLINKNLLLNSKVSINENKDNFCVICQDSITEKQIIRTLKFSHSFDLECIDNWLIHNKRCPICKYEI